MTAQTSTGYLTGQFLIAMPQMQDPRFARAVVYLCSHSASGAMGIIVNRLFDGLSFAQLLRQLEMPMPDFCPHISVHFGGPVEPGRGFVLHSLDYAQSTTTQVTDDVGLTATVDILQAMAQNNGPRHAMLALGYAGWSAGQLDEEIKENAWLTVPADADLLFGSRMDVKWSQAIHKLGVGVDVSTLSAEAGHA